MADMFCCALPSLLMNQIQIAKSRLPVSILFKERRLSEQFVSCRNSVIARASNTSGPIFSELGSAELEQADIRARALLGIKIRLDFGHRLHKARVQTECIGSSTHGFATLGTIGFEGRFDYAAIGTVSNVASRLCDEAKPGQILISPRVLMKVENAVKVEPVGEFELKGIRRPLAAYNVIAPV
jgi:hypothetical protein